MTIVTKLLEQRRALSKRAVERTLDVNEGYLLVHNVMAKAFSRAGSADPDLGPALMCEIDARAERLRRVEATV